MDTSNTTTSNDEMPGAEAPPYKRAKRDYGVRKIWLFIYFKSFGS